MIEQLHLLRPWWLLALIPLCLMLLFLWKGKRTGAWQAVCDAHLIPHILDPGPPAKRLYYGLLLAAAGVLAILALAGPAWQKLPQPVFKQQSALVVILDLSKSMDAQDLTPSRLERARLKLLDLLRLRKEGQTALIVYAGDAFVVTPLTDDTETITALTHSLSTDLMPLLGSRPGRAVEQALALLSQVGALTGSLLLITDGVEEDNVDDLSTKVVDAGYRLSVIAVGTREGAPIPVGTGGFVKDSTGQIVVPKLDESTLMKLAGKGGGVYSRLSIDDADIEKVLALTDVSMLDSYTEKTELYTDQWREEGPWLILLLLPIAMFAFRRGLLMVVLTAGLYASDPAQAFQWSDLWLNANQKGARAMERQDYSGAASTFRDEQWKATAYYRAGKYEQALANLEHATGPDATYNRGNALAKLGRIEEAIRNYEQTLAENPKHEDARHNLELLRQLKEQQQSPQSEQQQNSQAGQQNDQQDQQDQGGKQEQKSGHGQSEGKDQQSGQDQQPSAGSQGSEAARQQQGDEPSGFQQHSLGQQQAGEQSPTLDEGEPESGLSQQAQTEMSPQPQTEQQQADEQWLRRVPDDPAGLLRRKFRYQYSRRYPAGESTSKQW